MNLIYKLPKRNIYLVSIIGVIFLVIGVLWQYNLVKNLNENKVACGGDWSYSIKCPFGSFCQPTDKRKKLIGGFCQAWLIKIYPATSQKSVFQKQGLKDAAKQENNSGQNNWHLYQSQGMHFAVRYPPNWESAKSEMKLKNGRTWFIRTGPNDDVSINFSYSKYTKRFYNERQKPKDKILSYSEVIAERLKEVSKDPQFEFTDINLGGRQGKKFRFNPYAAKMITEPKDLINYEIYIPLESNNIFTVSIIANEGYIKNKTHQQTLKDILSSIVFIASR